MNQCPRFFLLSFRHFNFPFLTNSSAAVIFKWFHWPPTSSSSPPPTPPLYDADCHSCPVAANVILLPMAAKCHHRQINKVRDGFVSLLTAQAKNENTNKKERKKERKKIEWKNRHIFLTYFLLDHSPPHTPPPLPFNNIIWIYIESDIVVSSLATHLKVETWFDLIYFDRFFFLYLSPLFLLFLSLSLSLLFSSIGHYVPALFHHLPPPLLFCFLSIHLLSHVK